MKPAFGLFQADETGTARLIAPLSTRFGRASRMALKLTRYSPREGMFIARSMPIGNLDGGPPQGERISLRDLALRAETKVVVGHSGTAEVLVGAPLAQDTIRRTRQTREARGAGSKSSISNELVDLYREQLKAGRYISPADKAAMEAHNA